jgi:lipoate---protein ligase
MDTIILCQTESPYLCVGLHQTAGYILDLDVCQQLRIPVYQRHIGGGTTLQDRSQLFYQCVFHHKRLPPAYHLIYKTLLDAPVNTLRRFGLPAEMNQINEIEVSGKRIGGTGGGRIGEATIVVGNILFDFNITQMAQLWNSPRPTFRELAVQALYDRLVTFKELRPEIAIEAVKKVLIQEYQISLNRIINPGTLHPQELVTLGSVIPTLIPPVTRNIHSIKKNRILKISARENLHYLETMDEEEVWGISLRVVDSKIITARVENRSGSRSQETEEYLIGKDSRDILQLIQAIIPQSARLNSLMPPSAV